MWLLVRYRLAREAWAEFDAFAACAARACADRVADPHLRAGCLPLMLYYNSIRRSLPSRAAAVREAAAVVFGFDPEEVVAVCQA